MFGILAARWRIHQSPIIASTENAESYVLTTIALHNKQRLTDVYRPGGFVNSHVSGGEIQLGEWCWIVDYVAGMSSIPNVCGSQYLNNAFVMHEALKDYALIVKLAVFSGNEIMCGGHEKKPRRFKTRHLCDLLRNFKTITLIRKPKKYLKMRANFSKVASCQPVITPTSICLFKVKFKRTRTRCEICWELKTEIEKWHHSSVFIVNFKYISIFFLLTLNMLIPTKNVLNLLKVNKCRFENLQICLGS